MNEQKIVDCWMKYKAVSDELGGRNLSMLQRLIWIVKVMKNDIFIVLWDMEKPYYDIE